MTAHSASTDDTNSLSSLLVVRAANKISSQVERSLSQHGLTLDQWHVLSHLAAAGGSPMSDIATVVVVSGPTLTRIIDRLVSVGLVHRNVDLADRRRVLVHLTPRGRSLHRKLAPVARAAAAEAIADLTPKDGYVLTDILHRLVGPAAADSSAKHPVK